VWDISFVGLNCEFSGRKEDFKEILLELKERQKKKESFETKVEVLRGKEGINTILKMILSERKDYVMLGGGEQCCEKEFALMMGIFTKRGEKDKLKGRLLERGEAEFFVGKHEKYRFILRNTTAACCGDKVISL